MKKLIKRLIRLGNMRNNPAEPLVTISISRSALLNNLNQFRANIPNHQIAPVLKSNAYGHGLTLVANELKNEDIPFFVIDSYFEAKALRNEKIANPLLIIGYSSTDSIVKNNLKNIIFTITSLDSLKELSAKILKPTHIHLKIDTGMHRQGILPEEKEEAIEIIKANQKIILDGICSHLSDADNTDQSFTKKQIALWNDLVKYFKKEFPSLKHWHISASAGYVYKHAEANVTRLGIGLYGLVDFNGLNLRPVLEMKTIITSVRRISKGESLGYNNTYTASTDMAIATIPVGYNEGLDRRLSNKGFVKIDKQNCPILGRVSMNITIIDISKLNNVKIGDEVIVISATKNDLNSIENIAKICDTIPYEIAVHIPQHLRRILIK